MRIAFFDTQTDTLSPQQKGHLLERLARRILQRSGYTDVELRVKHSSLEYDVEGRHNLTGRLLTGEAKAHDSNIPGKELSAFVGKLIPLALKNGQMDGVFISTSSFTGEGKDYLDNFPEGQILPNLKLKTFAGNQIPDYFHENKECVSEEVLRKTLQSKHSMELIDSWLIVSDRDEFMVCTGGPNVVSRATHYICCNKDASPLNLDSSLLKRLEVQLPDLSGLLNLHFEESVPGKIPVRQLPGIASGAGWFDYKFPAPPECFIGRKASLEQLLSTIEQIRKEETSTRTIQLLSRSGVGKSSLLLKISTLAPKVIPIIIDGRNLRVPGDVRLVFSELVARINDSFKKTIPVPRSLDEISDTVRDCSQALSEKNFVALIEIDQFESCLSLPQVFSSIVDIVSTITSRKAPIVWLFARKNDVAVTFDAGANIELGRLNEISKAILLEDFSPAEGKELLGRLSQELGQVVRSDLAQGISTFSGGFPWLHKRLCAHVLSMHKDGISQRDLIQAGLRAEDLFQEDLAGLGQQDLALLKTIAAHLPNTSGELARRLENDVSPERLTQKLNEFLGTKLLRLSGDIYDTYNDVFKTFLVTDRIPFQARYVFRVHPGATMKLLQSIPTNAKIELSAFQAKVGGNKIAVLNKLRELRLLGLIAPEPGFVALSVECQSAIEKNELFPLLRKSLKSNGLISRILDQLSGYGELSNDQIVHLLRQELPHVEVSQQTIVQYATLLRAWIHYADLARIEGVVLKPQEVPPGDTPREREFTRGTFKAGTFLPSVRPKYVLELVNFIGKKDHDIKSIHKRFGNRITGGLIKDAESLDLVEVVDGKINYGHQARILVSTGEKVTVGNIAQIALAKDNMKGILKAAVSNPLSDRDLKEVLRPYGTAQWTSSTWKWRLGILRSWLVATGQAKSGKKGLSVELTLL